MRFVWLTNAYTNEIMAVNLDRVQTLVRNTEGRGTFVEFGGDDENEGALLVLETAGQILASTEA